MKNDVKASTCPTCGYRMDSSTLIMDPEYTDPPRKGDLGLCFKCGEVLVYREDGSLLIAGLDDMMTLDAQDYLVLSSAQDKIRKERPLG